MREASGKHQIKDSRGKVKEGANRTIIKRDRINSEMRKKHDEASYLAAELENEGNPVLHPHSFHRHTTSTL